MAMNPSEFTHPDDEQRAIEARCLTALAQREHSRAELAAKLHGFTSTAIESVLDTLAARGWQSDARFAEAFVRNRLARGQGRLKVRHELEARGIHGELLRNVLDAADWADAARSAYLKKYSTPATTAQEKVKRQRFLAQRGFSYDDIQQAMKATHDDT